MNAIQNIPLSFSRLSSSTRQTIALQISVIAMLAIAIYGLYELRENQLQYAKRTSVSVVESAYNTTKFYYDQFKQGKITESDAKDAALIVISHMTYGNGNYVYVYSYEQDKNYTLLVNKVRPDLIGVNRYSAKSSDGVFYVQSAVNIAKHGGGFYSYMWDAGGTTTPRPKISYALGFEPWSFVIGTGDYVDGIIYEFWSKLQYLLCFSALCIALGSSLLTWLHSKSRDRHDDRGSFNSR